ncbi:MAG: sulfatase-like hydrolase/transferase [Woeseiales bacterium]
MRILTFLLVVVAVTGIATAKEPANVVLIMADDLGFEALQCYGGGSYQTPHLDMLASNGIRFNNCHATPLCTPSRVRLMTGRYSFRNFESFAYLNSAEKNFGKLAKEQGYATCVAGKWQLSRKAYGRPPNAMGFDEYCVWYLKDRVGSRYADPTLSTLEAKEKKYKGKYGPDVMSDFVCEFIEKNKERPFFVYYPMVLTHDPFVPTPDSKGGMYAKCDRTDKGFTPKRGPGYDVTKYISSKFEQQCFADMIAYTDKIVGKIVDKLEELNLRENTLIIFTCDNGSHPMTRSLLDGELRQGGKGAIHEFGTHVPLIVNWKGKINGSQVCDDLIDFADIYPTIAEAIDAPITDGDDVAGISFMPRLMGEKGTTRDHLFLHYDPAHGKPGESWVGCAMTRYARTKKWKLYNDGRLYEVIEDRTENDIIPSDRFPEIRAQLQKHLDAQPAINTAVTPTVKKVIAAARKKQSKKAKNK